jgi:DNA-binding Xre family transcriptional regulator
MNLHFGEMLHSYFEDKRIRRAVLARLLNLGLKALMQHEKNESIQTKRLLEICTHLKHNFFMDIAIMLPPEYSTTQNPYEEKDKQIAQLEEELKLIKAERDVLLKVLENK